ncbi:heavy metal transport/detoxification protein [Egbenema bharatensis]|uniref:heavy metal transport/detoxification protein n=1 Tax=Egbenema bharatensis TaxID=3463334 RepID=UPI003A86EDA5
MALKLNVPTLDSPKAAEELKKVLLTSEPDAQIDVNAETKIVTVESEASEETFKQLITASGHKIG